MKLWNDKRKRKFFIVATVIISILMVLTILCAVYLNDYYHADDEAIAEFIGDCPVGENFVKGEPVDDTIVYAPDKAEAGLIFYPGGKVEYTAYIPLMKTCASEGILCVVVEMPFNLAVLDVNAAEGIQELYPEIDEWYIGGHSLGGSMAASYLSENMDTFEGLILLGSYSTADLSDTSLDVLSIYGSEDKVLNREKYDQNKINLPNDFTEVVLDGGCHAYFGMYGEQEGDGTPTISNEEQIEQTANVIVEFIYE
ncbi:MAG: alpha/beta hydrolase [Tyzzerella sp.]|nr:alpha/beta hydrolase [Tyzzerella sp.]